MLPQKAYIIRISSSTSQEYAKTAAESCERVGMTYEFFEGTENLSTFEAWTTSGLKYKKGGEERKKMHSAISRATCATVSHARLWKQILDRNECAVILEHDSIMLHKVEIDIPDNALVVLGYKLEDISRYDHIKAGNTKKLRDIREHEGAHAYAITAKTAAILLKELEDYGVLGVIDNTHFLKVRKTRVPLYIADPTPVIGWLRKSTIWDQSSSRNTYFIDSFNKNLKV